MKTPLRLVVAVLTLLVAASGLSACSSHVGSAAYVGDFRISEKTINSYLTAQAKTYTETTSTGSQTIVPKNYALQLLIQARIFEQTLVKDGGAPQSPTNRRYRGARV